MPLKLPSHTSIITHIPPTTQHSPSPLRTNPDLHPPYPTTYKATTIDPHAENQITTLQFMPAILGMFGFSARLWNWRL
ncbi:hypothetical protein L873DRAFT_1811927 [Choiromyces venosus 120613-1]|uniref:Uncharacterized protein n=1 Tax=Choiromyces venosus 120613-1 TaxID=1336337 RepID=A0A3N4JCT8_9PEZI|nr:hypothetical protein L873DRAFT_1811927 [Choiromyces venosus 120613-1]